LNKVSCCLVYSPLYVQDFAKDKVGAVLNNKGTVKAYTNVGINEQKEQKEVCDECGAMQMSEGECMECGWKGEVGAMEESERMMCECGGEMREGECMECGYKMEELDESGHLSDIYNVEDLGDAEFDYVMKSWEQTTWKSIQVKCMNKGIQVVEMLLIWISVTLNLPMTSLVMDQWKFILKEKWKKMTA